MDFADIDVQSSLVTSRRDLDARRRTRDAPTPKKRMRGLTPVIFFEVDAPKSRKQVFGDPQNICVYDRGGGRHIKRVGVISERHKKKSHKKVMEIIKTCDSEQANKKTHKKHDKKKLGRPFRTS